MRHSTHVRLTPRRSLTPTPMKVVYTTPSIQGRSYSNPKRQNSSQARSCSVSRKPLFSFQQPWSALHYDERVERTRTMRIESSRSKRRWGISWCRRYKSPHVYALIHCSVAALAAYRCTMIGGGEGTSPTIVVFRRNSTTWIQFTLTLKISVLFSDTVTDEWTRYVFNCWPGSEQTWKEYYPTKTYTTVLGRWYQHVSASVTCSKQDRCIHRLFLSGISWRSEHAVPLCLWACCGSIEGTM